MQAENKSLRAEVVQTRMVAAMHIQSAKAEATTAKSRADRLTREGTSEAEQAKSLVRLPQAGSLPSCAMQFESSASGGQGLGPV
jgi:hypothetical protein